VGPGPDEVDEIRQQIDESRENLGAAVGALAYKADVKNRGKEVLEDKKEAVMEKVDELKSKVTGGEGEGGGITDKVKSKLPDADAIKSKLPDGDAIKSKLPEGAPSGDDVKAKAQDAAGVAQDHPVAVTAGAAAVGLVAGLALPESDLEREKLAPTAQKVRADVQDRVQDTVEQVKHGAKDAVGSVADAVKDKGQEHGGKVGELADKAADKTQQKVGPDS
jgi:gas vesicle protein